MQKHVTNSEKETFNLAKKFARRLKGGEIIALIGNLGAGKTVFVKGLAAGLGVKEVVNSPTFVLMKMYQVKDGGAKFCTCTKVKSVLHVDAYRIQDAQELIDVGINDYLGQRDVVTVIEWANRVKKILPKNTLKITISGSGNQRKIQIK